MVKNLTIELVEAFRYIHHYQYFRLDFRFLTTPYFYDKHISHELKFALHHIMFLNICSVAFSD